MGNEAEVAAIRAKLIAEGYLELDGKTLTDNGNSWLVAAEAEPCSACLDDVQWDD